MIPELGHFALSLALAMALLQATLPLYGSLRNIPAWVALAVPAARGQMLLLGVAFACLTAAFVGDDFSVAYVANHSNSHLPLIYRVAGVWGGHEGSLLLWALILALWSGAVSIFTRDLPDTMLARVLSVMAMINIGFLLFMLLTSNPFERILPAPAQGRDLNPILQDIGLALHPPMLYLGYVGFSVAFAFAIAALIGGRLDAAWARWTRPWTSIAWTFLTIGIALGSWWAYYELGWGGWWFWDPVENASFMPWLGGTALIHSLAATESRGVFKAWTALLAMIAFSLSLLGTFLVRSGVLTSVHAFASDPSRGLFILIFLGVVIGGSLALYAWRAPTLISRARFAAASRESALLINNLFFATLCFAVLLGTLYPLILDALSGAKISVGAPYFNFLFALLGAPLALFIGVGALLRWKQDRLARAAPLLLAPALLSLAVGASLPLLMPAGIADYSLNAALALALGCWVILGALAALRARVGVGPLLDRRAYARIPRGFYGMIVAHAGVGVFIIGVAFTNAYSIEKDVRMATGETFAMAGYSFRFNGVTQQRGANYDALRGAFEVRRDGRLVAHLSPEKRTYLVQKSPTTEAAIDAGLLRDLYVALGEPLTGDDLGDNRDGDDDLGGDARAGNNDLGDRADDDLGNDERAGDDNLGDRAGAWSVRIYYKPFIRWIWLGALIMALGGFIAATDRRYRRARAVESDAVATAAAR
ncbi:MAG: heme lyase CcmF/NrfE family subunit [bacterium]